MPSEDVLVNILESHVKHQELVELRLIEIGKTLSESNERLIRLESIGFEARLQEINARLAVLETKEAERSGSHKLLNRIPGWIGWLLAVVLAAYEYVRATTK